MTLVCVLALLISSVHILNGFYPTAPRDDLTDIVLKMEQEQDKEEENLAKITDDLKRRISKIKSRDILTTRLESQFKITMKGLALQVPYLKATISTINKGLEAIKPDLESLKTPKNNTVRNNPSVKSASGTVKPMKKPKVCPGDIGFKTVGNICLRLSDFHDVRTWQQSRDACQKVGSDLITFQDAIEETSVLDYLHSLGKGAYSPEKKTIHQWVGMKRQMGHYKWISDSTFPGKWIKYAPFNSDDYLCICVRYTGLSDEECDLKKRYICQI